MTPSGFSFRSAAQAFAFARASHAETTSPLSVLAHAMGVSMATSHANGQRLHCVLGVPSQNLIRIST